VRNGGRNHSLVFLSGFSRGLAVYGELADQVVDARCGGHARAAGDGLPPACFPVGDRLGHGEHRREVLLRDDDEAAGIAADYVPGTDGHAAALHDDVDRTQPGFLRTTLAWQRNGRLPPGAMVKLYFGGELEFGLRPTLTALEAYLVAGAVRAAVVGGGARR
jgi:hypothetical protein